MKNNLRLFPLIISCLFFIIGCSAEKLSGHSIPGQLVIDEPESIDDSSGPRFLFIVKPVSLPDKMVYQKSLNYQIECKAYEGPREIITASLKHALLSFKYFSLIDSNTAPSKIRLLPNEHGPYIVNANITEYGEDIEKQKSSIGQLEFDKDTTGLEAAAKFATFLPAFWFGQITGLPTEYESQLNKSLVVLDITVTDPRTKQILLSFPVRGTFQKASRSIGSSNVGFYSREQIESTLEAAMRVAVNDAVGKIYSEMKRKI